MPAVTQSRLGGGDFITYRYTWGDDRHLSVQTKAVQKPVWVLTAPSTKGFSSCMRSRVFLCHVGETVMEDSDSGKATLQTRVICGLVWY